MILLSWFCFLPSLIALIFLLVWVAKVYRWSLIPLLYHKEIRKAMEYGLCHAMGIVRCAAVCVTPCFLGYKAIGYLNFFLATLCFKWLLLMMVFLTTSPYNFKSKKISWLKNYDFKKRPENGIKPALNIQMMIPLLSPRQVDIISHFKCPNRLRFDYFRDKNTNKDAHIFSQLFFQYPYF